jgi:hypothetical protein
MMTDGKWSWWLLSLVVGGLSAAIKAPFFAAAGLTTFLWLWFFHRRSARAWFFLSSAGIVSLLLFFVWNVHCHRVYAEAEFSTLNLNPFDKNSSVHEWYFGSSAYRFHLANWLRGGWHLTTYAFGSFVFVFLILLAIRAKDSKHVWLGLLSCAITTLIFPVLLLEHIHYFFIFASIIAWLCALGTVAIESRIQDLLSSSWLPRTAMLLAALAASLVQSLATIHINTIYDPYDEEVGHLIEAHTTPNEKIIVWGECWGGPFQTTDREGFTGGYNLDDSAWINDPQKLKRIKQLGYTKIVLLNQSPLNIAMTTVSAHAPGDPARIHKLENLHEHLPAVAKNWPVVFETPQILIVQIPEVSQGG